MELALVPITKDDDVAVIIGQAHFIKTVEDLHEALATAGGTPQFGIAFCEASGPCLIRRSGNSDALTAMAVTNAEVIGAGHCFVICMRDLYPINVLNAIKLVPEVCSIFCATSNMIEVIVTETDLGRAVLGVVDGMPPSGVESAADDAERRSLLRGLGYKL